MQTIEEAEKQSPQNWPGELKHALVDTFDFLLQLRNGQWFRFSSCRYVNDEWVHISEIEDFGPQDFEIKGQMQFDRGIDIRVSDISWICDAPQGS